jgi:alkanesulfonate monooxygenase SsuD/methylene tetrahydromethanopterin reductase-like flavin-dependent oxidoreductase (luciferase family)
MMKIDFGVFDHLDRGGFELGEHYRNRLKLIEHYDEVGLYAYHLAEHHGTSLGMAPSPSVFLSAVAQRTERLRMGPMVYVLPVHEPLRLIEEICMLDQLSHGRFEIGVGRGVSPFELNFHKVDHDKSRDIFLDAFACLSAGLAARTFSYAGTHFTYDNVPMALEPVQKPHPAFWYGSSNAFGSTFAGEQGMHFLSLGPTNFAKINIDAFRVAFAKRGGAAFPKAEFRGGAAIGVLRNIVVADTDAEAQRIAGPAMAHHLDMLNWLRNQHGSSELAGRLNVPRAASLEENLRDGSLIAGTPDTVVAAIERQTAELGINYLLSYLFFGKMTLAEALRSLQLMRTEVMPRIAHL